LFFCATFTSRRKGDAPSVQAGAETSDTGAEAVNPDSHCSWQGHARRVGANVGDEVTEPAVFFKHSAFHRLSAQRATLLLLS